MNKSGGAQMIRYFIACLLLVGMSAQAATVWEQDWEMAVAPTQGAESTAAGISYQGNCYKVANGGPFDSVSTSTKYKRKGSRSVRLETDSRFNNGLPSANCASNWKTEGTANGGLGKHRNEIRYGYGIAELDGWDHSEERWFRASYYIPSDEGDYSTWRNSSRNIMIHQSMARLVSTGAASSSHELALILRPSATVETETVWLATSVGSGEVHERGDYFFQFKIDAWNDVLIRERRHWQKQSENPTSFAVTTIWANCATWTPACTPIMNIQGAPITINGQLASAGRNAIQTMDERFFKGGLYEQVFATGGFRRVMYMDAIKLGKRTTETVDEMFTIMADAYTDGSTGGDPSQITSVNSGAALTQNQFPVAMTANNVNDIFDCHLNNNGSDPLLVNWNRTLGTGVFSAGNIEQYQSSTATLKCYDLTFDREISLSSGWNNGSTTDTVEAVDIYGYTTGLKIVKSGTSSSADAYKEIADVTCVSGNRCRFDFSYHVADAYKNNMYFHVGDAAVDNRIRLVGTAGELTPGTPINAGFGTSIQIANRTAGNGVYRASIWWTVNQATQTYKIRAGWSNSVSVGHEMTLLDVVFRKNWTTTAIEYPVNLALTVVDNTAPTVSPCAVTNVLDPQPGVTPTPYIANVTCTTTEIGGDYFVMLKGTNAAPADSDAVIAGTGALRFSSGQVDSTTITAEFSGMTYQDLWAYVVHRDAAGNKSAVAIITFDAVNKQLKLGTVAEPIMRGGVPLHNVTYSTVTIYSGNKAIDNAATVLTALQNVPVTNGVATGTEAHVIPGQPSLNTIPNGTYWVLSSRPNGETYAISYGKRAIVTE